MALINLYTMPGLGKASGGREFPDFPKLPDLGGSLESAPNTPEAAQAAGQNFADMLESAISAVAEQDRTVEHIALDAATGVDIDPHQLMIATAKAETLLHLTSSVSTKMAQNVQTIMNMQI
ncbi:MAG: flagellar hook-basal body complex protein FliE [Candidatus Sericytochromatia bacterium]|uniref:Flagellar hook-basal body complex protein FliE n=1 Tax=Candidatus Tanganyikabacteria bacterium TaxID=2961651 RepID=A0A938BPF0_9BACT|nr:flagellar hook-basal body complex protein FliE [Candidatus Tanganyikabacteria bacterium]